MIMNRFGTGLFDIGKGYVEDKFRENFIYCLFVVSFWLAYPFWVGQPMPLEVPFHLMTFTYAIYGGLLLLIDKIGGLTEYKLKRIDGVPSTTFKQKPYREILTTIFVNHIVHALFYIFFWVPYVGLGLAITESRPNPIMVMIDLGLYYVTAETMFTLGHKLVHQPVLYKTVHAKHHEIHDNQGMGGFYMGIPDFFVQILIPIWGGIFLTSCLSYILPFQFGHWLSTTIYLTTSAVNNIHVHSGYHFWGLTDPSKHQTHHVKGNKNHGEKHIDEFTGSFQDGSEVWKSEKN